MKGSTRIQYKIRQSLYKPRKGKISVNRFAKDFGEMEKVISDGMESLLEKTKKNKDDDDKDDD